MRTDNLYPREEVDDLPPMKRRAYAAHQNAYENFPFFAAAVLVATIMGAPINIVNWLAVAYIALRIAHGILYIFNKPSLRSGRLPACLDRQHRDLRAACVQVSAVRPAARPF